jgi:hypothetical protein
MGMQLWYVERTSKIPKRGYVVERFMAMGENLEKAIIRVQGYCVANHHEGTDTDVTWYGYPDNTGVMSMRSEMRSKATVKELRDVREANLKEDASA